MLHPEFYFCFCFRNSEGNSFGNHLFRFALNFCVNEDILPLLALTRRGKELAKESAGSDFPRKYQRVPQSYYQYAKFRVKFQTFSTVLVIFQAPR